MAFTPLRTNARTFLTIGTSALALLATPAMAQDEAAADEATPAGNTIIVTAQFREQALQDTPLAITAVDADLLEARSQTNLTEVANQAPSVTLRPATGAFGPSISASIRGLGQIDFNPQLEPGVGMYIDDVYYPRLTGANFDLLDVERVEILRGPQGTLTGRNSEGGAIKFVSRKPNGDNSGYVLGTYGSRNRINLRASADFALADGVYGRISGTFADQGGYVDRIDYGCANPGSGITPTAGVGDDCVIADMGDTNYKAMRGMLRFEPTDTLDIMISADYATEDRNQSAEVLLYGSNTNPNTLAENGAPLSSDFICGKFCNYATYGSPAGTFTAGFYPELAGLALAETGGAGRSTYEGWGVSGNVELELSDAIKVTSITAYREFDSSFDTESALAPVSIGFGINSLASTFFSQELRVNAELNDMFEVVLGGYISDETTGYDTLQDIRYVAAGPAPIYPLQFLGKNPVDTNSQAVYGTVFVYPTENLTITLGGRYTDESKSTTFGRLTYDGEINPFLDPVGSVYGAGYVGPDTLGLFPVVPAAVDPNGVGGYSLDAEGNPIVVATPISAASTEDVVTALNGFTGRYAGNRFDWRASVDYRFSDSVLAYATVSTGFKGGGVSPRPFNAAQVQPFNPEELTAYEVGIKTDFFDNRVRLNIAGYINKFKDAQLTLLSCPQFGGPGPCALPQNAGDATIKGFEVELSAEPVDNFNINASLSVLDFNWDCVAIQVVRALQPGEENICSTDPALVNAVNTPPRGVAKTQWSVGAQYEIALGEAGSLTPRIDVSYQSELQGAALVPAAGSPSDQFGRVPAYTLANGRLTWRNADEDLEMSLEVTNIFDKYYFYNIFDLTGAGAGAISANVARPREWAVSVKKKF